MFILINFWNAKNFYILSCWFVDMIIFIVKQFSSHEK